MFHMVPNARETSDRPPRRRHLAAACVLLGAEAGARAALLTHWRRGVAGVPPVGWQPAVSLSGSFPTEPQGARTTGSIRIVNGCILVVSGTRPALPVGCCLHKRGAELMRSVIDARTKYLSLWPDKFQPIETILAQRAPHTIPPPLPRSGAAVPSGGVG